MAATSVKKVVQTPALQIQDDGRVRIGFMAPSFPPVHAQPRDVADDGRVRTGFMTPAFPPVRAR
jgi:hypothetical protein